MQAAGDRHTTEVALVHRAFLRRGAMKSIIIRCPCDSSRRGEMLAPLELMGLLLHPHALQRSRLDVIMEVLSAAMLLPHHCRHVDQHRCRRLGHETPVPSPTMPHLLFHRLPTARAREAAPILEELEQRAALVARLDRSSTQQEAGALQVVHRR